MKLLSVLLCLIPFLSSGQNLISNGGFEKYSQLPDLPGEWYFSTHWDALKIIGDSGTPDYYHAQGWSLNKLSTNVLTIEPHTEQAVFGIIPATLKPSKNKPREYISTKLNNSMQNGKEYFVSFWITNGNVQKLNGLGSDGLGLLFSTTPKFQINRGRIDAEPTITIDEVIWQRTWHQYRFRIKSDSSYNYLTFGNFKVDSQITFIENIVNQSIGIYYFLDDFEILPAWLYITGDTTICKGEEATLRAFNGQSYNWKNLNDPESTFTTDSVISVSPEVTTRYAVYDSKDTAYFTVYVRDVGKLDLGNDTTICAGSILELRSDFGVNDTVVWNEIDTNSNFQVSTDGIYTLEIFKQSCVLYDTISIKTEYCDCEVNIPNAFSPNGDNLNDLFTPIIECTTKSYNLKIYNRWGDIVFESFDITSSWDGTYKGRESPSGRYSYRFDYTLSNGQKNTQIGSILLLK